MDKLPQLYPDPSTSPLIKRGANISTLRLSIVNQNTQWNIIRGREEQLIPWRLFESGWSVDLSQRCIYRNIRELADARSLWCVRIIHHSDM